MADFSYSVSRDTDRYYSYHASREYCEQIGVVFVEEWVNDPDRLFYGLELTQEQVDALMRQHIWIVKRAFTPTTYLRWTRVKLALHFLFGG